MLMLPPYALLMMPMLRYAAISCRCRFRFDAYDAAAATLLSRCRFTIDAATRHLRAYCAVAIRR